MERPRRGVSQGFWNRPAIPSRRCAGFAKRPRPGNVFAMRSLGEAYKDGVGVAKDEAGSPRVGSKKQKQIDATKSGSEPRGERS